MKIKNLLAIAISIVCSLNVAAQFRWGAEAGVNISHALSTTATRAGFNVGFIGEYDFNSNWSIDAALKLSSQPNGDEYTHFLLPSGEGISSETRSYTPYYMSIPVRAGYGFKVSQSVRLSLALGPQIGIGLFGRGHATSIAVSTSSIATDALGVNEKFDNIYSADRYKFAASRFQYGGNIRLAATLKDHYRLAAEYSILHIAGVDKAVDNISLFSINLGYVF